MKFRTTVENEMKGLDIHPGDGLTLLGSCFADHIGRRMVQSGLDAHANPFGVLYNPLSIAAWCRAMATGEPLPEDIFFESGGLWHSWLNDSFFSAENREECRACLENVRCEEAARFRSLKVLFLTLGTNRYYRLNDNGRGRIAISNPGHGLRKGSWTWRGRRLNSERFWRLFGGSIRPCKLFLRSVLTVMPNMVFTAVGWGKPCCCWPWTSYAGRMGGVASIFRLTRLCWTN